VFNEEGITADLVNSGSYEMESACERLPARSSLRLFYDLKSERVKA